MIFLVRRSVLGGETFEMYEVTFASRKAESAYIKLRKRGPKILAEIDQALEQLETNPKDMELMRKRTIRKMKGKYTDKYRISTSSGYRIVYEVAEEQRIVKVYKIAPRGKIGY